MTRRISVFWVLLVFGSVMLAWFVFRRRIFWLFPLRRSVFFLGSPSVVSVGNEPFSYLRFILWAFFRPPDGFFLCRSPCHTDICCDTSVLVGVVYEHDWRGLLNYSLGYDGAWGKRG